MKKIRSQKSNITTKLSDKKNKKKINKNRKRLYSDKNNGTSSFVVWIIYVFRILLIFFLVLYPLIIALTSVFDLGVKNLIFYIVSYMPSWFKSFLSFGDKSATYDSIDRFLPFLLFIVAGIIFLFFIFLPFFKYCRSGTKGFLGFLFLVYSIITIGFVYFYEYYLVDILPHNDVSIYDPTNDDYRSMYIIISKMQFSHNSFWMIATQTFGVFLFSCSIWCFIESILIRKSKLSYTDLLQNFSNKNSLVNYILKGKVEFGSVAKKDLKLSIPQLKNRIDEIDQQGVIAFDNVEQSNLEKQDEIRSKTKKDKLENEIKEVD